MAVRNIPREGDRYISREIRITVEDVDPAGKWANIYCVIVMGERAGTDAMCLNASPEDIYHDWHKQQPTPHGKFPDDWVPATEDWKPAPQRQEPESLGLPATSTAFPTGML